jgi:xanthosine utilization system XapX-like protein
LKIYIVDIIGNAILCAGALLGFVYSLIRFFKPKKAMYMKMVGCALGCLFIERLYGIVQYLVAGDFTEYFQVGTFGNIGCFMFLFSANFGAIDSLMDDGSPELKKYRRLALAAPLVSIAAAVLIQFSPSHPGRTITCAIEELFLGASAYYSLKLLMIPKRYSDFLSSLRVFHILSLVLAAGVTIENVLWCYRVVNQSMWIVPYLILLVPMVLLAPALERGTKQWRT